MMRKVLINFDFCSRKSSIVSGNILSPNIDTPLMTGASDYQNSAVIMNLPDGTDMQSPATVAQHNAGISGCVSLMPSGNVTNHNTIVAQSSANVPLVISGFWGGHETNLQEWAAAANQAYVNDSCKIYGYGFDAQEQHITNVALVPTLSGHAASMNYVDAQDLIQVNTVVAYSDAQDLIVLGFCAATYQPVNALLTALSNTTHTADFIFATDGPNSTYATRITGIGRTLISGATAEAMRTTLELGDSATLNVGRTSGTIALGNHESPIHVNDFFNIHSANPQWAELNGGNGTTYLQGMTSSVPILEADEGDGYMRTSNGGGSASTDWSVALPRDEVNFGSIFRGGGRKHLFRGYYTSSTSIKAQWGITAQVVPSGMVPAPSFVFVVDSANTNIRFQHDDGNGNTSDTDTGLAIADYVNEFSWSEIHCISGQVTAYYNGAQVAQITTNLPNQNKNDYQFPFTSVQGNGATWRSVYLDLYMMFGSATRLQDGIYT